MKKIAFIGAGSFIFTRNLVRDILTFPAFFDCEIALMDIDKEKLDKIALACEKIVSTMNVPAKVTKTTDRRTALNGADGVLCTVFNGGTEIWKYEIEVPKKYGIDVVIGDTRSIAGIFRALRNIPLMLDICKDIEEVCPNAVFLNYTNPMAMLCRAMQLKTKVNVTGLCHSVQGTISMLAKWLDAKPEDMSYLCAGINHQAYYLDLKLNGKDAYPLLREKLKNKEIYNEEIVRNEMFLNLDYYVTESSPHNSEYTPWFRKRPDLIEKYCIPNDGVYARSLNYHLNKELHWREEFDNWINNEQVDTNRSSEYAANIFNACFGDGVPFKFNGNVLNHNNITNLPENTCVEIPVYASTDGIASTFVGALPDHIAILVNNIARVENLVVDAAFEKNKRKVFQACCMDPLAAAACSLDEIKQIVDELFELNRDYLGDYR